MANDKENKGSKSQGIRLRNEVWAKLDEVEARTGKSIAKQITEMVLKEGSLKVSEKQFEKMLHDLEAIKVTNRLLAFIAEDYFNRLNKKGDFADFLEKAKKSKKFEE
jgi:predicted DNA-binding protein